MSYQVLARKWRPKNFQELMGQEHVVTVLSNALSQQRLHHAYLFTGTRGVGKTTIARIFAKSLNCLEGISATPCGTCDVCQDIDQGRFVDLLEIDAASRTKVDDTREILDNVQYAPTRGRYKVYLIDEVHMLSRSSFNALLKTLEEPPEHVKFILATTDPQKLPITVLSRCLQFHLKALMVDQINQHLQTVLTAEKVTFESAAVLLLAKAAKGSIRDSLSLADQSIAQGQGHITLANVRQMLGGVDDNWVFKLLIDLIKNDSQSLMGLAREIATYAPNYSRLIAEFIQLLHQIAMYQAINAHFDLPPEQSALLVKFSKAMSPDDVQLYYQIVLNGRKDLPYAADEQSAFEMILLRLLAFKPQANVAVETITASDSEKIDFNDNALPHTAINQVPAPIIANENNLSSESFSKPTEAEETQQEKLENDIFAIEQAAQEQHVSAVNLETKGQTLTEEAPQTDAVSHLSKSEIPTIVTPNTVSSNERDDPIDSNIDHLAVSSQVMSEILTPVEKGEQAALISKSVAPEVTSPEAMPSVVTSPVESVLATRNMLRSRKKALEKEGKKSDGAAERQHTPQVVKERPAHVPELEALPQQGFAPDVINPAEIKLANQVDRWANMIDTMELGGRLRVLAGNSTICDSSTEDTWVFKLNQSVKHLKSEVAHQQLEENLSELLKQKITIVLELVEATKDDPFQIQSQINDKRLEYAKTLINNDNVVQGMAQTFQATIVEESIAAR
ncbi:MAG: DNA polymerase III subunit gamma/tau [Thalassotalea sp.]